MTRKRFTKLLRGMGASTKTIQNYTNTIINLGGQTSYKEVYNKLVEYIIKRFIYGNEQPKIDFTPFESKYEDNQTNYLLSYGAYGAKVIEPSCVVRANKIL